MLAVMLAGVVCPAAADSWPAAQIKEVFSASREWFVRVIPGTSVGDTVGFAGAPKGKYAQAEFYQRTPQRGYRLVGELTLKNPVAPVMFLVTDRGYLLTLDNWHNLGYGKVVAGYSPDGRSIFAYALSDLFSREEIDGFSHSVSSISWRTETVYVRDGQRSVYVGMDGKGTELIVEPETGAWQHCAWRGPSHLCRDRNDGRVWRGFREPAPRR